MESKVLNSFVCSWSGGKDSCFAFMQIVKNGYQPKALLNMMNENGQISRSHAIPKSILQKQAAALDLPITTIPSTWLEYEEKYISALRKLVSDKHIDMAVFGDIDLQPHKDWEEKVCKAAGIEALLPLWQENRKHLVLNMIASGIKAYIVSCNSALGEDFLGRLIDEPLIEELEAKGIDVCGENGEYHTLVVHCPLFKEEVKVTFGKKQQHNSYWFLEMK